MNRVKRDRQGRFAGSYGTSRPPTPALTVPTQGGAGGAGFTTAALQRIDDTAARLQVRPETLRQQVKIWASKPRAFEPVKAPLREFQYGEDPEYASDPGLREAMNRLGYHAYLAEPYPVFVYGTLRSGQYNESVVGDGCQERATATADGVGVYGRLYPFPYAAEHPDPRVKAVGELMWIKPGRPGVQARARLDNLEGFDKLKPSHSHYLRVARDVQYTRPDGTTATTRAWIYLMNTTDRKPLLEEDLIPGGDWVAAREHPWGTR